jgi:hypothetical protein
MGQKAGKESVHVQRINARIGKHCSQRPRKRTSPRRERFLRLYGHVPENYAAILDGAENSVLRTEKWDFGGVLFEAGAERNEKVDKFG